MLDSADELKELEVLCERPLVPSLRLPVPPSELQPIPPRLCFPALPLWWRPGSPPVPGGLHRLRHPHGSGGSCHSHLGSLPRPEPTPPRWWRFARSQLSPGLFSRHLSSCSSSGVGHITGSLVATCVTRCAKTRSRVGAARLCPGMNYCSYHPVFSLLRGPQPPGKTSSSLTEGGRRPCLLWQSPAQ